MPPVPMTVFPADGSVGLPDGDGLPAAQGQGAVGQRRTVRAGALRSRVDPRGPGGDHLRAIGTDPAGGDPALVPGHDPVRTLAQEQAVQVPQRLGDTGQGLVGEKPCAYARMVHVVHVLILVRVGPRCVPGPGVAPARPVSRSSRWWAGSSGTVGWCRRRGRQQHTDRGAVGVAVAVVDELVARDSEKSADAPTPWASRGSLDPHRRVGVAAPGVAERFGWLAGSTEVVAFYALNAPECPPG